VNNVKAKYEMNGKYLEQVIEDLGVIIQSDLKCSEQCLKAVGWLIKFKVWSKGHLV